MKKNKKKDQYCMIVINNTTVNFLTECKFTIFVDSYSLIKNNYPVS